MINAHKNNYTVVLPGLAHASTFALLGYPLDTIKTRIQSSSIPIKTIPCAKDIFKANGILGFYRGISSVAISQLIRTPIQFPIFEYFKKDQKMNNFSAGAMSTAILTPISTPLEVIKVNSQATNKTKYNNSFEFAKKYYLRRGVSGFYQGFQITLLKDVVFGATFLGTYSYLNKNKSMLSTFSSGSVAHVVCWLSFIPIDNIKTMVQMESTTRTNTSIKKAASSIIGSSGISGLWKGVVPATLRMFPVSGVGMVVYEYVKCSCAE